MVKAVLGTQVKNKKMDILVFSDIHGHLPKFDGKKLYDVIILPGDVCPVYDHRILFQKEWLSTKFKNWVEKLPLKPDTGRLIMCAGNHDFFFDKASEREIHEVIDDMAPRLVYLNNEEYVYDDNGRSVKFYGTPDCKVFGTWAFMKSDDALAAIYDKIPEDVDILFSHDAADINYLGMITQGFQKGKNAGSTVLADFVKRKKPKYYFCGHIHSGNHELTEFDGIKMANVSMMVEGYIPINKPYFFAY